MEILIFKTSVQTHYSVIQLKPELDVLAGEGKWNFALDDCDRILRIKAGRNLTTDAIQLLDRHGFGCTELED